MDTYRVKVGNDVYKVDAATLEDAKRRVQSRFGQPVPFKEGFRPPTQHTPHEIAEDALEFAPAIGGTVGAAVGNVPGAMLGAGAGEAARQLGRRALSKPAATGIVTGMAGMDPNSSSAAAANIALEALMGGAGEKVAQAARWAKGALSNWATKSRVALLGPRTAADDEMARQLAERLAAEDIAPSGSSRALQVSRAQARLSEARSARESIEKGLANESLDATPVLEKMIEMEPRMLPTGATPQVGMAERAAHRRVSNDVLSSLSVSNDARVPLPVAQSEKRRWDALLQDFYRRGAINPAIGQRYSKGAADAWRRTIAKAFPDLGAANMRESDLIDILRLLKAQEISDLTRRGSGAAAAAVGAGAVGRMAIPAAVVSKGLLSGPRFTSWSAAKKDLASRLLMNPEAAQVYIRMGALATPPEVDIESFRRRRAAEQALAAQGEGVTTP